MSGDGQHGGRELRVGIVGSGFIAGFHSAAFRQATAIRTSGPGFVLQRVASRNRATADSLAARYGWEGATTDWRHVTRGDDVDLVAICTPEDSHREIADDAFAHGKHVFCEKPLATSSAEARAMQQAADRAGTVQFVGLVLRCWPAFEVARRLVESGELGALKNVRARYLLDSATVLESSLRGLGSHVLDALTLLAGPVASVAALTRPTAEAADVDGRAAMLLSFAGGATGVLEVDREARGRAMDLGIEVDCEHGGVSIHWRRRDVVEIHADGRERSGHAGTRQIVMGPATSPFPIVAVDGLGFGLNDLFVVQAEQLATAVGGERQVTYPAFGDACHVADVTDAILEADRDRAWTAVATAGATA